MKSSFRSVTYLILGVVLVSTGIFIYSASDGWKLSLKSKENPERNTLLRKNLDLTSENADLKQDLKEKIKQNQHLRRILARQVSQAINANQIGDRKGLPGSVYQLNWQNSIPQESTLIQQIFKAQMTEKTRWDTYLQSQYADILNGTLEPAVVASQHLVFEDNNNRDMFIVLESSLNLHKRLVRDVRLFYDEVLYQQKREDTDPFYQLYDLKFDLEPFARESAMVDALQQAMSALSVGLYQEEAVEVMDRLGGVFVEPIHMLIDWINNPDDISPPDAYNYNFYIVFGKKLMDYADHLAVQSLITLAPSALGELDFFSRRIAQSLALLYEAGVREEVDSAYIDLQILEQDMP